MLLNNFYEISNIETDNISCGFIAIIKLNPEHEIYKGHFPGNPVTPGVCLIQIVKETTEFFLEEKLFLKSASNIKFLSPVKPNLNPELTIKAKLKQNENGYSVDSVISYEEIIFMKFKGEFTRYLSSQS